MHVGSSKKHFRDVGEMQANRQVSLPECSSFPKSFISSDNCNAAHALLIVVNSVSFFFHSY